MAPAGQAQNIFINLLRHDVQRIDICILIFWRDITFHSTPFGSRIIYSIDQVTPIKMILQWYTATSQYCLDPRVGARLPKNKFQFLIMCVGQCDLETTNSFQIGPGNFPHRCTMHACVE